jgi:hypothetical protein
VTRLNDDVLEAKFRAEIGDAFATDSVAEGRFVARLGGIVGRLAEDHPCRPK